jgi:hypothetical protein
MKKSKAVVVIPFYKDRLSSFEQISLKQCLSILSDYDIVAIKPDKLNLETIIPVKSFAGIISFDDNYFETIYGYNQLMLSAHFYKNFLNYEYILIYQLDAFVFADQLEYWCDQGFDYIGAPWLRSKSHSSILSTFLHKIKNYRYVRYNIKDKNGLPKIEQLEDRVGNGGFSLRRVSLFVEYCSKFESLIESYRMRKDSWFNEDIFWAVELNRKKRRLKIPNVKKALQFAFETNPFRALKLNNNKLPFGCHAWDKNLDFWRPIFKEKGYDI